MAPRKVVAGIVGRDHYSVYSSTVDLDICLGQAAGLYINKRMGKSSAEPAGEDTSQSLVNRFMEACAKATDLFINQLVQLVIGVGSSIVILVLHSVLCTLRAASPSLIYPFLRGRLLYLLRPRAGQVQLSKSNRRRGYLWREFASLGSTGECAGCVQGHYEL